MPGSIGLTHSSSFKHIHMISQMGALDKNEQRTLLSLLAIFVASILIFFTTWESIISIWLRSDTYAHGMIVLPVSTWLVWRNKSVHKTLLNPQKRSLLGLLFLLANGLLWIMASITHVLVIQQYAVVGLLIGSLWFFLGNTAALSILFPLCFLYMMVPVGEGLLPDLMILTADISVFMLKLTGITVFREGLHLSLVSGDWEVVEACSGLRYLIATITLGLIYAYITYTKAYKRLIFALLSFVIPLLANGLRAYMIIMIGHMSDMTLAVGVDHLIYGAAFFGIIIFVMFYIGSFWKDAVPTPSFEPGAAKPTSSTAVHHYVVPLSALLISLLFWPIGYDQLQRNYSAQLALSEWHALANVNHWKITEAPNWKWRPAFKGAESERLDFYINDEGLVIGIYQANFGNEIQGAELVNSRNTLITEDQKDQWRIMKQLNTTIQTTDSEVDLVILESMNNNTDEVTTLKWYQVGNYATNKSYFAKAFQLIKRLTLNTSAEIYFVVYTETHRFDLEQKVRRDNWLASF